MYLWFLRESLILFNGLLKDFLEYLIDVINWWFREL